MSTRKEPRSTNNHERARTPSLVCHRGGGNDAWGWFRRKYSPVPCRWPLLIPAGGRSSARSFHAVLLLETFFLQLSEGVDPKTFVGGFLAFLNEIATIESNLFVFALGDDVVPIGETGV